MRLSGRGAEKGREPFQPVHLFGTAVCSLQSAVCGQPALDRVRSSLHRDLGGDEASQPFSSPPFYNLLSSCGRVGQLRPSEMWQSQTQVHHEGLLQVRLLRGHQGHTEVHRIQKSQMPKSPSFVRH